MCIFLMVTSFFGMPNITNVIAITVRLTLMRVKQQKTMMIQKMLVMVWLSFVLIANLMSWHVSDPDLDHQHHHRATVNDGFCL